MESWGTTSERLERRVGGDVAVLIESGLLAPGPNLPGVKAYAGDTELRPILESDPVARTVTCFHPDDGFVTVSDENIRTWRLDCAKFVGMIGRQLGQPASFRPTSLVEGLLWDLGTPRLDRTNAPVLFARRLGNEESRARIRAELDLRRGTKPSIMLTTAQRVSADLVLPAVSKVVPIIEVLDRISDSFRLDTFRLAALVGSASPVSSGPEVAVVCDVEGHWITIRGRSHNFRGKQAKVIRRLYEVWERGEGFAREQEVLEGADSTCKNLKELFRGKSAWRQVIEVAGGNCRLLVGDAL